MELRMAVLMLLQSRLHVLHAHTLAFIPPIFRGATRTPPIEPTSSISSAALTEEEITSFLVGRHALVIAGQDATIGLAVAEFLSDVGASVTLACKSPEKYQKACNRLNAAARLKRGPDSSTGCELGNLDLSKEEEVWSFAESYVERQQPLHLLVNCADDYSFRFRANSFGGEQTFSTNHLGPFLLSQLLLDQMYATMNRDALLLAKEQRSRERASQKVPTGDEARARRALQEQAGMLPRPFPSPLGRMVSLGLPCRTLREPPQPLRALPFSRGNYTAWGGYRVSHQANTLSMLHLSNLARQHRLPSGDHVEINVVHCGACRYLWQPVRSFFGVHRYAKLTIGFLASTPTTG
eukprot:6195241-Pleurochrysis_carterae.AAC.1